MKKALLLISLIFVFIAASTSHADIIKVFDFNGSYDASKGEITNYSIYFGDYNPTSLGTIWGSDLNGLVKVDNLGATFLTDFFQRTFVPRPPIEQDEWTYMYKNNLIYGNIQLGGADEPLFFQRFYYNQIPDLSAFHINALYLDNSFSTNGATGAYDIQLLADATPVVPEPSSLLLLGGGIIALVFIRKRSRSQLPLP